MEGFGSYNLRCSVQTTIAPVCEDTPIGWKSSTNQTCENYHFGSPASNFQELCLEDGSAGAGWALVSNPGETFADYADSNGVDASEACCACGGGSLASVTTTRPMVTCKAGKTESDGVQCSCPTDCRTCEYLAGSVPAPEDSCTVCKSGNYLSEGYCITESECLAKGGSPKGFGQYNKKCRCPSDPLTQSFSPKFENLRLKGSSFRTISTEKVLDPAECATLCVAVPACKSFEFKKDATLLSTCRLMNDNGADEGYVATLLFDWYNRTNFCME